MLMRGDGYRRARLCSGEELTRVSSGSLDIEADPAVSMECQLGGEAEGFLPHQEVKKDKKYSNVSYRLALETPSWSDAVSDAAHLMTLSAGEWWNVALIDAMRLAEAIVATSIDRGEGTIVLSELDRRIGTSEDKM